MDADIIAAAAGLIGDALEDFVVSAALLAMSMLVVCAIYGAVHMPEASPKAVGVLPSPATIRKGA